nr:MAG: RNA-dependent RNA polymerase [Anopheles phasivirus 2]
MSKMENLSTNLEILTTQSLYSSSGPIKTGSVFTYAYGVDGLPLPHISVTKEEEVVRVSLIEMEDRAASTIKEDISFDLGDWRINNIVHDFTFGYLATDTDKPLFSIFKKSGRELTKFTPDYVVETADYNIIVEFATAQGSLSRLSKVYDEKFSKYEPLLQQIHVSEVEEKGNVKPILFGIIVVGLSGVCTNLELNDLDLQELQLRLQIGNQLKTTFIEEGLLSSEENLRFDSKKLQQFFIKLDSTIAPLHQSMMRDMELKVKLGLDDGFLQHHLERWNETRIKALLEADSKDSATLIQDKVIESIREVLKQSQDYCNEGANRQLKSDTAHINFERSYIEMNKDNMKVDTKAMIQFPFFILQPTMPDRRTSKDLVPLANPKLDSAYDLLYYAAIINALTSSTDFLEKDIIDQLHENDDISEPSGATSFTLNKINVETIDLFLQIVNRDFVSHMSESNEVKKKLNRFSVTLSDEQRFELAVKGVQAKSLAEDRLGGKYNSKYMPRLKDHRSLQKDWYDIQKTDTSDLDDLMADQTFFKTLVDQTMFTTESTRHWINLSKWSRGLHGSGVSQDLEDSHTEWLCKTPLFSWCKMISDIGTELNISLKQNCKYDQFIFKKLQDFPVWLLIKPTKKEEKVFFSLLYKQEDVNYVKETTVFKRTHKLFGGDQYMYTNFISLTESKILNWVLCLPRMMGLFRFWSNFSGVEPYSEHRLHLESENSNEFKRFFCSSLPMLLLTILISLNDKAEVEEEITRTRYMVMECLTEWPIELKPYKMVEKAPTQIRSRLTLWLYRRHKQLCSKYCLEPPKPESRALIGHGTTDTSSSLVWTGFLNPYTWQELDSPQQVINLFYLGYIKNKDEVAQANKISKLYDKILTYELKFTKEISEKMGLVDTTTGVPHCFNVSELISCSGHLLKRIKKMVPEMEEVIEQSLSKFLFNTSIEEEFATLKASSGFNQVLYDRKRVSENYTRVKVIEQLAKKMGDSVTIADLTILAAKTVFSNRCLHIDIFRKAQHGGDREIYVLGFEERVVQRLIEQIGRVLCGFIQEETMTHPYNKIRIPENTNRLADNLFRRRFFSMNSSADASKWSQNNCSFKLLIPLLVMTPKYMHSVIIRVLQLWEFKKIMINPQILELFDKHKDLKFYDETVQRMYSAYKGFSSERWLESGKPYLVVTTGMMQGILHYCSSLYHSVIISRVKSVVENSRESLLDLFKLDKRYKIVMCHLQSSDDSYFSVNLPTGRDQREHRLLKMLATSILTLKVKYSEMLGVVNSSKTVLNSRFCFEFNSNFEFGTNHYKPDIKAVYSGFLISEQELLLARQEELSTLLTGYIENGGTNYVANGLQLGQSYLHYHLIGLTTTKYFRTYAELLMALPDPSLGFFLMDNPLCPGLLGVNYNIWNATRSSSLGKLYKDRLKPLRSSTAETNEHVRLGIELSAEGFTAPTYKMVHGNRKKWQALVSRCQTPDDWRDRLMENPILLFRRALTADEVKLKIAMKLHSPGVSASLSNLNTLPRILSESAYILKYKSVSTVSNWFTKEPTGTKTTLIESLLVEIKRIHEMPMMTSDELKILFPFNDDFVRHHDMLQTLSVNKIVQSAKDYKRRETLVEVATNHDYSLTGLRNLMISYWFGDDPEIEPVNHSRQTRDFMFNRAKKVIPWLSKDSNESLESSPFQDPLSMFQWLNTFAGKKRTVRLLGTQIVSRFGLSRIISVVVNNLSSNYKIVLKEYESMSNYKSDEFATIKSSFALLATYPWSNDAVASEHMTTYFASKADELEFTENEPKSRQNDFHMVCKLSKLSFNKSWRVSQITMEMRDFLRKIIANKHGTIGYFRIRQRCARTDSGVEYYGPGEWIGIVDGFSFKIELFNKRGNPTEVRKITTNSRLAVVESYTLRKLFEDMKWVICGDFSTTRGLRISNTGINAFTGAEVLIDDRLVVDEDKIFSPTVRTVWSGHNFRCIGKIDNREFTIVSIKPKLSDISLALQTDIPRNFPLSRTMSQQSREIAITWLGNGQLFAESATAYLNSDDVTDAEKELLRLNFNSKLESNGLEKIGPRDVSSIGFISETDLDMDDFFTMQLDVDMIDLSELDLPDEEPITAEDFGIDDFEIEVESEIIQELLNDQAKVVNLPDLKREAVRNHKIMRGVAKFCIGNFTVEHMQTFYKDRIYTKNMENSLSLFEGLLVESRDSWTLRDVRLGSVNAGQAFATFD